jgi:hypothetical protein
MTSNPARRRTARRFSGRASPGQSMVAAFAIDGALLNKP